MSHLKNIASLTLLLILLSGSAAQAQKWGEVNPLGWKIMPPEKYIHLGAAVILDKGIATTERRGLTLNRHVRSILLNEAGLEHIGEVTIECYEYDNLTDIKAQVLSPDGTVRKISKKTFTKEIVGSKQINRIKFTDIVPGDIVEYQYKLKYYGGYDKLGAEKFFLFSQDKSYQAYKAHEILATSDWDDNDNKKVTNLPTWYFDNPVYTFSSVFSGKIGADLDYLYYTTNLPDHRIIPDFKTVYILTSPVYKMHSWSMENVPPFVPDTAEIVEAEAQRSAVHFRLFSTNGENRIMRGKYTDEHWQFIGQSFQGYANEYAKTSKSLRKKARNLTAKLETEYAKLEAIYEYIIGEYTVDPSGLDLRPLNKTLKKLYESKNGKPFELNLLLVEMLRISGLQAAPILISTRDKLSFRKSGVFNHMIIRVEIAGEDMLVDLSSSECPLGKLPKTSMVTDGVGIDYDNSKPVQIIPIGFE